MSIVFCHNDDDDDDDEDDDDDIDDNDNDDTSPCSEWLCSDRDSLWFHY